MAEPVDFPESDLMLYPPDARVDEVVPLRVRKTDRALVSCWKLKPAELEEISRTGRIWLAVEGVAVAAPAFVTGHKREALGSG